MAAAGGLPHPLRMSPWRSSFPAEVHEHPAEVVRILLDPVVEGLHILAVQEAQDSLLELARALPGDDLDERCLLRDGLGHDRGERVFDLVPAVVDVVQVELELHGAHRPPLVGVEPGRHASRRSMTTKAAPIAAAAYAQNTARPVHGASASW